VIGEEISEQLEIIPMRVRVIRHIRKPKPARVAKPLQSPPTSRRS
jgi:hypothetical protein